MSGFPFEGVIPVADDGKEPLKTSPFIKTEWDNDTQTIPSFNPHALSKAQWENDDGSENSNVFAFRLIKDEWQ